MSRADKRRESNGNEQPPKKRLTQRIKEMKIQEEKSNGEQ